MATRTAANGQTVVHKTSDGRVNTFPDVCKTQVGNAVVPIPYSNTAVSQDTAKGSKTVFVDGNPIMLKDSVFSRSAGDEAGSKKGVGSGTVGGEAKFVNYSFDVSAEGRNVCRRLDPMTSNKGNTPPAAEMQPNISGAKLPDKYLLSFVFEFEHKDGEYNTDIGCPLFERADEINGPQRFENKENSGYMGDLCHCDQPGDYSVKFGKWDKEEEPLNEVSHGKK